MRQVVCLLLFALLTVSVYAQKPAVDPPAAARTHFTKTYPTAIDTKWKQGSKQFKAEFKIKSEKFSAHYTTEGAWVRTEHNIPKSDLPAPVTKAVNASKYGKWKVDDVEEHSTPEVVKAYKVKLKTEGKSVELFYAPDGKLLREKEKAK